MIEECRVGRAIVEQEPVIPTELKGVLALHPRQVICKVMRWYGNNLRGEPGPGERGDVLEGNIRSVGDAAISIALADKSVAQVIDDRIADGPHVAARDSFRIVDEVIVRRSAGKLDRPGGMVVLQ